VASSSWSAVTAPRSGSRSRATHMDDFRVIRHDGGEPPLLCRIAPATSPIFGNNPGYQVYQFDRETGALRNYQPYYLTNLAGAGRPPAPSPSSGPSNTTSARLTAFRD
jgi:hypothetical protein